MSFVSETRDALFPLDAAQVQADIEAGFGSILSGTNGVDGQITSILDAEPEQGLMGAEQATEEPLLREGLSDSEVLVYQYIKKYIADSAEEITDKTERADENEEAHESPSDLEQTQEKLTKALKYFEVGDDYRALRDDARHAAEYILLKEMKSHENEELPEEVYALMRGVIEINPYYFYGTK